MTSELVRQSIFACAPSESVNFAASGAVETLQAGTPSHFVWKGRNNAQGWPKLADMNHNTPPPTLKCLLLLALLQPLACQNGPQNDPATSDAEDEHSYRWPADETEADRSSTGDSDNPWLSSGGTLNAQDLDPLERENPLQGTEEQPEGEGETVLDGTGSQTPDRPSSTPGHEGGETASPSDLPGSANEAAEPDPIPRLLFHEYFEGEGSIKALGVENLGENPALGCVVEIYANGGTEAWRRLEIREILGNGGRALLCTSALDRTDCTDPMSTSTFNGNDALVLRCAGIVVDSFGQVGQDPGAAWVSQSDESLSSQDARLLRCSRTADISPMDPFTIEADWVVWGETEDEFEAQGRCRQNSNSMGGAFSE